MRIVIPFLLAVLAAMPSTASAQEGATSLPGAPAGELVLDDANPAFGLATQDYWLPAPQFYPLANADWQSGGWLYYYAASGSGPQSFVSQLELPAGARVQGLQCFFNDVDGAADADVILWEHSYELATDTPFATDVTTVSSSGDGGYQKAMQVLDETVRYRDGDVMNYYSLIAYLPGSNSDVQLYGCRLFWSRQITAAPGTATFDDVPTSHPFFQHVEALVGSGITSGCGGGDYCPDAPLTRGQMAVFLATALGLHWPY